MNSKEMVKIAYNALDDKKANDIKIINIGDISSIGDYLVIADGSNNNHVQALCDNVDEMMHKSGYKLKNREGYSNGGWILLDYYDIIVHIFSEEERSFYDLEHIWRDGGYVAIGEL
ncbi:MAG: ribosome silencing factor [Lachnospiraceae bacterium]|nr:ribosome silencing factor [Lachnospiraceae bacterium]